MSCLAFGGPVLNKDVIYDSVFVGRTVLTTTTVVLYGFASLRRASAHQTVCFTIVSSLHALFGRQLRWYCMVLLPFGGPVLTKHVLLHISFGRRIVSTSSLLRSHCYRSHCHVYSLLLSSFGRGVAPAGCGVSRIVLTTLCVFCNSCCVVLLLTSCHML